jgi:hypothetical protein
MRVFNLTEALGVTEAWVSHSADTDCNEERPAAAGKVYVFVCFLCERKQ